MTRWVVGIDGGGTKTEVQVARVAEDGMPRIAGRSIGGPANPRAIGYDASIQCLTTTIRQACAAADICVTDLETGCLALAGAGRQEERQRLAARLAEEGLTCRWRFTHDALVVLAATPFYPEGIAVIAGTGSIVYGRNALGREVRAGGWGYWFGDEGSGFALGRAGLQAVARSVDRCGPDTLLTSTLFEALGLAEPDELIETIYAAPDARRRIAELAPAVLRAFAQGDHVAAQLVEAAVGELAELTRGVARRLRFDPPYLNLAMGGGLFVGSPSYRHCFCRAVAQGDMRIARAQVVAHPVTGAVRLAAEALLAAP